ncbi:MAG: zinc-ribbon domain-containing protein [Nitrososphaerales archaeon]
MPKYCMGCGKQNEDQAAFCVACGTAFPEVGQERMAT